MKKGRERERERARERERERKRERTRLETDREEGGGKREWREKGVFIAVNKRT